MSSSSSNDEQDVKDVQITLVDCFVSNDDENEPRKDDIGNEAKRTRIHHGAGKRAFRRVA